MKILIVGFFDTDLSFMICAMLRSMVQKLGLEEISIESAGTAQTCSGRRADAPAIQVLTERGIEQASLAEHRGRYFGEIDSNGIDYIIATSEPIKLFVHMHRSDAKVFVVNEPDIKTPNDRLPEHVLLQKYTGIAEAIERVIPKILAFIGVRA